MDAQVQVSRRLLEELTWQALDPPPDAVLLRVIYDRKTVTFVFGHPLYEGTVEPMAVITLGEPIRWEWPDPGPFPISTVEPTEGFYTDAGTGPSMLEDVTIEAGAVVIPSDTMAAAMNLTLADPKDRQLVESWLHWKWRRLYAWLSADPGRP